MKSNEVRRRVVWLALAAAFAMVSAVAAAVPAASAQEHPGAVPSTPFTDLTDVGTETLRAVSCIVTAGITRGTTATTYSPSQPVTRRQMALFLTRLLDVARVPHPDPLNPVFTDLTDVGTETRSAIARLFSHGITKGTSETEWSPNRTVTRRQMALFLTRLLTAAGVKPVTGFAPGYDDTSDLDAESAAAVAQMRVQDVMRGISAESFAPTEAVTRDHMALFLSGALAVVTASKGSTPRAGCEDAITAHDAVERPASVAITVDPREPQFGDPVRVTARLADRDGNPMAGLGVRLVYDGRAVSAYVDTGRDGTVSFTIHATPTSLTSEIAFEVRLGNTAATSSATDVSWSPVDLAGTTPGLAVTVSDSSPTAGEAVEIVATVTDEDGAPVFGAELEFVIDGVSQGTAVSDADGQAKRTYAAPVGPANEGGYDSIQVLVVSAGVASRPVGVFWQPPQNRRIEVSISPDASHTSAARTITARVFDGASPVAGAAVELYVDATVAGRATTNAEGVATFTRRSAVQGPFDLARVFLADDYSVGSNEVLFSWPTRTRGLDPGNHWQLVWSDEFDGDSLDTSKWTALNECPPVYLACQTDRPENVEVSDGMLRLRSLRERYEGVNTWTGAGHQIGPLTTYTPGREQVKDFTSGRLLGTTAFTYGRFEMLARLPQGIGTHFAYWLGPLDKAYGEGASSGEIDIAEGANVGRGGRPRGLIDAQLPGPGWGIHSIVHLGMPFTNPHTLTNLNVNPAESFHLYVAEWDTASIRFYIDDQRVLTVPQSDWFAHPSGADEPVDNPYAPFDVPFRLSLHNQVGNWALKNWPGHQVPDTTVFPTEFSVDYIRVYECRPPAGTNPAGPGQGCETP